MLKSESIANIAPAFFKAQISFKAAIKDSSNPYFKSKYADLASVWDAVKDALETNQLLVTQSTGQHPDGVIVYTYLIHAPSAEYIGSELLMRASKKLDDDTYVPLHDPQAYGSLITYGRRYSLAALLGVVTEDDDAEGAMGRKKPEGKPDTKVADDFLGQKEPETHTEEKPKVAVQEVMDFFPGSTVNPPPPLAPPVPPPADLLKQFMVEFDRAKDVKELKDTWRKLRSMIEKLSKADQNQLTIYAANLKAAMTTPKEEKKNV
jgi:hypothetical protein